jgi:hypothetical protein
MKSLLRTALPAAIAAVAFTSLAAGQSRKPVPARAVVELEAGAVTLPSSTNGTLVMKACGKCQLKSYPVTRATKYYLYSDAVTLPELNAALAGQPQTYVGVTYSQKTGEIMSVRAHAKRVR